MKNKALILISFLLMVGAQWYIPYQMIQDQSTTLATGNMYKFKIAPVDPEDPFRGKFLRLSFQSNEIKVAPEPFWEVGESVYVQFGKDALGFARIVDLTKTEPDGGQIDYIKTTIQNIYGDDSLTVFVEYPFDRYYINERMAEPLEKILAENLMDSTSLNYATVRIRSGQAVLEEVYIDEVSVPEWYKKTK